MISENNLLHLMTLSIFKKFLKKFPVYQTKIINPLANEQDLYISAAFAGSGMAQAAPGS